MKDLAANASRIDGWRRTRSYSYFVIVSIFGALEARPCVLILFTKGLPSTSGESSNTRIRRDVSTVAVETCKEHVPSRSRTYDAIV
jgi:hypothetical protein